MSPRTCQPHLGVNITISMHPHIRGDRDADQRVGHYRHPDVTHTVTFGADDPAAPTMLEFYHNLCDRLAVPAKVRREIVTGNAARILGPEVVEQRAGALCAGEAGRGSWGAKKKGRRSAASRHPERCVAGRFYRRRDFFRADFLVEAFFLAVFLPAFFVAAFFPAAFLVGACLMAACAAARRATGTRYGEQLT